MRRTVLNGAALASMLLIAGPPAMAASTLAAGSGAPFSNYQPSLALNQSFDLQGIFPANSSGGLTDGATHYNLGMIRTWATGYTPGGQNADGRLLGVTQYPATYAIIGGEYGGNGTNAYAAPNLGGATIVGASAPGGQGALVGYQVAQTLGSPTVALSVSQLPPHSHTLPGGGSTGVTGGGTPIDQLEPSVTMTYLIAGGGVYPGQGSAVSIGQVAAFAGGFVPLGWRPADGSILNIADNPVLFGIIGDTFGGDGITTFALPDLRGRTVVGVGAGPGLAPVTLGETFGASSTVLTLGQMAAHDHGLAGGGATGVTGGATPVSNQQPSIGLNYLVAVTGVFPDRDFVADPEVSTLGEIITVADNIVPNGYLPADGRLLSVSQNQALFSLFGTTYGGDGVRTFALPDLRGRDVVGVSQGQGPTLGQAFGTESTVLTEANLPVHDHTLTAVPEPSTWTLLLLGVGLAGAGLRRRARRGRMSIESC